MKSQNKIEQDVTDLIKRKEFIFAKLDIKKNRTVDKIEYYGKKLRTIQAKIDVLMIVING